jgi:AcrR family transcriptional regulator
VSTRRTDLPNEGAGTPMVRGPYRKTAETRSAILDAALEVFAGSGFHAGSLRDVARRVGMSNAGVLHHFTDKETLLAAMLDHRDEVDVEEVRRLTRDGESALHALIDLAKSNQTKPEIVRLYAILSTEATALDHPAHEHFVVRYTRTRAFVREAFESLENLGHLAPGVTAESAAIGTIAMMDGLQTQWLIEPTVVDMPAQLAGYLSSVTRIDFTAAG